MSRLIEEGAEITTKKRNGDIVGLIRSMCFVNSGRRTTPIV